MKNPSCAITLVSWLAVTLSLSGCGDSFRELLLLPRKNMERVEFTQCFMPRASTDMECGKLKKGQGYEYCQWFVSTFYLDQTRQCYGQRWAIPKAYYARSYGKLAGATTDDTFVLEVGRPGLTPGITEITPGAFLTSEQRIPLFIEVTVRTLSTGKFEKRVREVMDARRIGGTVKTNQVLYGMGVYDNNKVRVDQYRDIFLFPLTNKQWYVRCIMKPGHTLDEDLKTIGGCTVVSNVDDRVHIEYHIDNSELPQLATINTRMTNLIRSFMVNE